MPLHELTQSHKKIVECREGLLPVHDSLLDSKLAFQGRKIPRIIHLTSKSRCLHPVLAENVEKWRLKNHSLFFHDDDAMDKLLYRDWPEFPQLKYVLKCLLYGGAAKADIWRILVLWEYGGVYADFDSYPHLDKFNESTITAEDEAFFVVETLGTVSQWFMAASPRHPMLYFTIHAILGNLINLKDVGDLPIVWTTGPGAVKQGFEMFMGARSHVPNPVVAGIYTGAYGRTARVVGSQENENEYIERNIYATVEKLRRPDKDHNAMKHEIYETMDMAHLTSFGSRDEKNWQNESCLWRMWQEEMKEAWHWEPNW
jgi:hypothetical protein